MAKINYTFADGHTEEIEVSDEFALQYELLEDDWKRQEEREKKRRRRRLSFEGLVESGYEFEDTTCADPLERLIEQENEKFSFTMLLEKEFQLLLVQQQEKLFSQQKTRLKEEKQKKKLFLFVLKQAQKILKE